MKYSFKHSDIIVEMNISNNNKDKHIIESGFLTKRNCGDCKRFLPLTDFSLRIKKNKQTLNSKCVQCHKTRKLISNSSKKYGKNSSTEKILGISYADFIKWLDKYELKHTDKGLHIDHTIPKSLSENAEDSELLNHYSNLKLMLGTENLSKGARYIKQTQLNDVLTHSPNPERLLELIKNSKIKIIA